MKLPPIPENDEARVAELHSYDVLDTATERAYDALVRIAAEITGRPIALVSLVDRDRQWFKARVGLDAEQTGRDESFCAHMVTNREPLVVRDALADERFADNPLVVGKPDIRFYAGAPLVSPNDFVLGSLCVIDTKPGDITPEQVTILELLADQAVQLLEMRRIGARWAQDRREARTVFEASLDLLCVASFDGYFVDVNQAWVETLGHEIETLTSRPFIDFIHPDDRDFVMDEIGGLREGGELREFIVRFVAADGETRVLQFNATSDPQRQRYIAAARDVTEASERAEALAAARDAAEQANRAKSVFLANMSHELRTPLNSVIGFANVLLKNRDQNLQDKQLDYLARIHKNGRHLLSLLNDILDVSKIEVGQLEFFREPLNIVEVVTDVVGSFGDASGRVQIDAPAGALQSIVGDGRRLRQVVTNLVGNALKFSPDDSRVTVRITASGDCPSAIEVIDRGIGIAEDAVDRVFEPFEQAEAGTERRFGGTGLGLTISKSLCESMGFDLTVSSELGVGSTFTIHFDPQTTAQQVVPSRGRVPTPVPTRNAPVLIVDDAPESRLLLESVVADLGFPVVACDTPRLAKKLAKALKPRAVLLDLMMPGVDGFDILAAFERDPKLREIPVVVVSIVGPENRARLTHAVDVLPKPTDREDLARILGDASSTVRRVLVVDDEGDARELAGLALEGLDVDVVECSNGAEALQLLQSQTFDAVVLDLTMPVMDGWAFLRHIRADDRFIDLPVVVFSALDGAPTRLSDTVSAIVRKDGDTDSLRVALERVL